MGAIFVLWKSASPNQSILTLIIIYRMVVMLFSVKIETIKKVLS